MAERKIRISELLQAVPEDAKDTSAIPISVPVYNNGKYVLTTKKISYNDIKDDIKSTTISAVKEITNGLDNDISEIDKLVRLLNVNVNQMVGSDVTTIKDTLKELTSKIDKNTAEIADKESKHNSDIAVLNLKIKALEDSDNTEHDDIDSKIKSLEETLAGHIKDFEDLKKNYSKKQEPTVNPPSLSFSVNNSTTLYYEKGTTKDLDFKWSVTYAGVTVKLDSLVLQDNNNTVYTSDTSISRYKINGVTQNKTYKLSGKYDTYTLSKSVSVTFIAPRYYGVVDEKTVADKTIFEKIDKLSTLTASANYTHTQSETVFGCPVYVYPSEYGAITSVKDSSNFENISSFERTTVVYNNTSYYVYKQKEEAEVPSGFKLIFSKE